MMQTSTNEVQMITDERTVTRMVREIGSLAAGGEHYQASTLERDLWVGVLEAIASGNAQAGYLAASALESRSIPFPRTAPIA